jgi:hypothetical protein
VDVLVLNGAGDQLAAGPTFTQEMGGFGMVGQVGDQADRPAPRMVASMNFSGQPAQLRIIVAKESGTLGYPFTLVVK